MKCLKSTTYYPLIDSVTYISDNDLLSLIICIHHIYERLSLILIQSKIYGWEKSYLSNKYINGRLKPNEYITL